MKSIGCLFTTFIGGLLSVNAIQAQPVDVAPKSDSATAFYLITATDNSSVVIQDEQNNAQSAPVTNGDQSNAGNNGDEDSSNTSGDDSQGSSYLDDSNGSDDSQDNTIQDNTGSD